MLEDLTRRGSVRPRVGGGGLSHAMRLATAPLATCPARCTGVARDDRCLEGQGLLGAVLGVTRVVHFTQGIDPDASGAGGLV